MGKQSHPRQRVVLVFSAKPDTSYDGRASLAIHVYTCKVETGQNVRNFMRSGEAYSGPLYLADLSVKTWASEFDGKRCEPYDCRPEYHDCNVETPEQALAMARTLKAIRAHRSKLAEQYGAATTFGQGVGRFASAIGAKQILWVPEGRVGGGWSHDEAEYQWSDVGAGVAMIDSRIGRWIAAGEVAK